MPDASADAWRILVILPTYNEIENLPRLVDAIFEVAPEVDVLVIDAPPGTGDEPLAVVELAGERSRAVVVTTPQPAAQKVAALT